MCESVNWGPQSRLPRRNALSVEEGIGKAPRDSRPLRIAPASPAARRCVLCNSVGGHRGREPTGPDICVGASLASLRVLRLISVRLRTKRRLVRVAEEAGIALVRVCKTQLVVLPEGLRLTAGAIRTRAVQWSVRVVIESREGAPRPTLVLLFVRTAPGYFTGQSGTGA